MGLLSIDFVYGDLDSLFFVFNSNSYEDEKSVLILEFLFDDLDEFCSDVKLFFNKWVDNYMFFKKDM